MGNVIIINSGLVVTHMMHPVVSIDRNRERKQNMFVNSACHNNISSLNAATKQSSKIKKEGEGSQVATLGPRFQRCHEGASHDHATWTGASATTALAQEEEEPCHGDRNFCRKNARRTLQADIPTALMPCPL